MFCRNCGHNMEDAAFCPSCGTPKNNPVETQQPQPTVAPQTSVPPVEPPQASVPPVEPMAQAPYVEVGQGKKKGAWKAVLGTITALALVAGGVGFYLWDQEQKEEARIAQVVSQFEESVADFQEASLIQLLDDENPYYQEYLALVASADKLGTADYEEMSTYTVDMTNFLEKVGESFSEETKEFLATVEAADLSMAYEEELTTIHYYTAELESALLQGDYQVLKEAKEEVNAVLTEIAKPGKEINLVIEQVDTSLFPTISVYVDARDDDGTLVEKGMSTAYLNLTELVNGETYQLTPTDMGILDQQENLCVSLVADVSGSMDGVPIADAKAAMNLFMDQMQFSIGDKVELVTFSDNVQIHQAFTSEKSNVQTSIARLTTGNLTALYDALYIAINRTASQSGAKYVMAFTDGRDNASTKTLQEVINLSQYYRVPVYIVSIGYDSEGLLSRLATETGGGYYYINSANEINKIYEDIYRNHKELYKITYETEQTEVSGSQHTLKLTLESRESSATVETTFAPNVLYNIDHIINYGDEIDMAIGKYLQGFVAAINSNNYEPLRDAVVAGSSMERIQSSFVMTDQTEVLHFYEIVSRTKIDENTYHVSTRETYDINYGTDSYVVKMILQEASYVVTKDTDGVWRLSGFVKGVKQSTI